MQEQIVRPIKLQPENAGADFMAYMTRSRKCESTSHGLHQYTNKKSLQKGRLLGGNKNFNGSHDHNHALFGVIFFIFW